MKEQKAHCWLDIRVTNGGKSPSNGHGVQYYSVSDGYSIAH